MNKLEKLEKIIQVKSTLFFDISYKVRIFLFFMEFFKDFIFLRIWKNYDLTLSKETFKNIIPQLLFFPFFIIKECWCYFDKWKSIVASEKKGASLSRTVVKIFIKNVQRNPNANQASHRFGARKLNSAILLGLFVLFLTKKIATVNQGFQRHSH